MTLKQQKFSQSDPVLSVLISANHCALALIDCSYDMDHKAVINELLLLLLNLETFCISLSSTIIFKVPSC